LMEWTHDAVALSLSLQAPQPPSDQKRTLERLRPEPRAARVLPTL
jgi:hypothetical protein